jgi:carbamoyltransferase
VRLEDVSKYFEWEGETRWMSFCPKVKDEWREKLAAITHVDNTARVQTVTESQNKWLYDLLTAFEKETGVGVLLNTSFNVNGKPILSSLREAFKVFSDSRMDGLIINEKYVTKVSKKKK